MATLRFLLKRFAAQRLLGLAVVVTLAFSVGVLVAGPIYADAAREAILSSALAASGVTVANARLQVFGDEDFDWADADAAVERTLAGVPTDTIVRPGSGHGAASAAPTGRRCPLFFRDGAAEHLEIDGRPPGPGADRACPRARRRPRACELGDTGHDRGAERRGR